MKLPFEHPSLHELLPIALAAGEQLREAAHDRASWDVRHKGRVDLVTDVDVRLQSFLIEHLQRSFPGETILAEEADTHHRPTDDTPTWYVDPLDGTTNFVHGFPFFSVSIARWFGREPDCAVVVAPALGEVFYAARGQGAWAARLEDLTRSTRLHGSGCEDFGQALIATGFPYHRGKWARLTLACCSRILAQGRGVRRAGSAAIDLCYLAAGRLDGFFEFALHPWDVAAGAILAREAGLVVTDFQGADDFIWGERVCAAPASVHGALLALIQDAHRDPEHWPLGEPFPGPVE